jgi:hypothetical protein
VVHWLALWSKLQFRKQSAGAILSNMRGFELRYLYVKVSRVGEALQWGQ